MDKVINYSDLSTYTEGEINDFALSEYNSGNYDTGKKLFEENARINPSYRTFNNLGVFYSDCNFSKAKHYLLKANLKKESSYTYAALGELFFNERKYQIAQRAYRSALRLDQRPIIEYNLGVVLFHQGKYLEAFDLLKKSYSSLHEEDARIPLMSCIASLICSNQQDRAMAYFDELIAKYDHNGEVCYESLFLAYSLRKHEFVANNYLEALGDFHIIIDIFKCVIHSLVLLNRQDEAQRYKEIVIRQLEDYEVKRLEKAKYLQAFKKANNSKERLMKFKFLPQPLFECRYYNCNVHETVF